MIIQTEIRLRLKEAREALDELEALLEDPKFQGELKRFYKKKMRSPGVKLRRRFKALIQVLETAKSDIKFHLLINKIGDPDD